MERWLGHVALVTGATAGIGEAIAEKLVEHGMKVIGLARRKERLDALAKRLSSKNGKFYGFVGDVTIEKDIINAFDWTKQNVGPVSILVNNAGISIWGPLASGETKNWRAILDTNVLGVCIATREAIKHMNENDIDGQIININSIGGHRLPHRPVLNLYPPSKHALTALTESLRRELAQSGSKIRVTSLSPGMVDTELRQAGTAEKRVDDSTYKALTMVPMLKSADVADAAVYILSTPTSVNIAELIIEPVGELI
ncbi:farnesol dehydrogenase-like [Diorhabda carinulata]|uniref:farnesol dehydrogenase-like n=1 Tax=Diorhabda carinulata TaxID=1163345 RepID=UPI0025A2035A|nr:farnesol dehydrogenase-like [Diorhabda carinulata]